VFARSPSFSFSLSLSLSACLPACILSSAHYSLPPTHRLSLFSLALLRHTGCQPATRACPSIFSKHPSSITPISGAWVLASASQLTDIRARCMCARPRVRQVRACAATSPLATCGPLQRPQHGRSLPQGTEPADACIPGNISMCSRMPAPARVPVPAAGASGCGNPAKIPTRNG